MRKHPPALNFHATIDDDATKHSPPHVKEPIDLLGSPISGLFRHTRQIPGADENSSVRFCAAGKIFATRFLLDGRPVSFEYRQLVLAVSPKMVIQSLSADLATDPPFSVPSPEHDDAAIKNISLFRRRKPEIALLGHVHLLREQPRHPARRKRCRENQTQRRPRAVGD
jgi:hypothetical protein